MNKIIILVGENISNLTFQCGGRKEQGLLIGDWYESAKWVHHIDSTSRKCPEEGKHPKVYQKWLTEDINYCIEHWNYIVSTNSMNTINIVSDLVRDGIIGCTEVEIVGLSEDNREVIFKSGVDSQGYLMENWPIGFLSLDW